MPASCVVAIHQPNFLPWLGFFHKMSCADVFVLLDTVPFTKNSYQNRVRITTAQGAHRLTVPVLTKGRFGQLTNEVEINSVTSWQKTHLATLRTNYGRAPHLAEIMAWLEPLYEDTSPLLATFCRRIIEAIHQRLGLHAELVLASSLGCVGAGSELLLRLVQAVGGDLYLSGPSGRGYLDMALFAEAGIAVQFHEFHHPSYPQLFGDFVPGLSIIDLFMNVGVATSTSYLSQPAALSDIVAAQTVQANAPISPEDHR